VRNQGDLLRYAREYGVRHVPIPTLLPSAVRSGEKSSWNPSAFIDMGETLMLTLEATAIKVITKGGGIYKGKKESPTHYVVFNCPKCDRRNKQSMYEALYVPTNNERLPFKCQTMPHRCGSEADHAAADRAPPTKLLVTRGVLQKMAQDGGESPLSTVSILGRP